MADNGEKTELPTGKKLDDAAKKGQVAYSKEVTAALMFLILLGGLRLWGGGIVERLSHVIKTAFSLEGHERVGTNGVVGMLHGTASDVLEMLLPIFALVLAIVLASGFLQVGVSFYVERMGLRWGKLNPVTGMSKLISARSAFTVGLSILKLVAVAAVVWVTLDEAVLRAGDLSRASFTALTAMFVEIVFTIGFRVGALILFLAIIDLFWTRYRHTKDLMMTKEEVKEERKQAEGSAEVKSRIKSIQREVARARMMKDVPKATVVVRNPTHFAVALRYDREQEPSPRVVAKGRNLIALRIISIAEEAGVPVRSDPPLARQIYKTVPLGKVIPEELFRAVAKVLAWVYRQQQKEAA